MTKVVIAIIRKFQNIKHRLHKLLSNNQLESIKMNEYIVILLTTRKPSTVWITINYGKFWKKWEYQTTWPASWETCMQVRKQQLELDMEH